MPRVYHSKIIKAESEKVWQIIRDFGDISSWFPFIVSSELINSSCVHVGVIRKNITETGTTVFEKLLELSDIDKRIKFSTWGDVPTLNYVAKITVREVTADNSCFIDWAAFFDADANGSDIAEWVKKEIFTNCLNELEKICCR